MITENYVSFETAKLLKEKGFDGILPFIYVDTEKSDREAHLTDTLCNYNDSHIENVISAPTLQMVMKWLREVHNLFIEIMVGDDDGIRIWYDFDVINIGKKNMPIVPIDDTVELDTYEEACEAAIKYCLENLI